jgi:hypothetical protein
LEKKYIIKDILLEGGIGINVSLSNNFFKKLGLKSCQLPIPYNLIMVNVTTTKLAYLIKNLKIHISGIPYMVTFVITKNTVLNASYFMLSNRPQG